jgi:hypothetical protein
LSRVALAASAVLSAHAYSPDELLQLAAGITIYKEECGALGSKGLATARMFDTVHGVSELQTLSALTDVMQVFNHVGKEKWCNKMFPVFGQ